jgi:DNA-binding LytR/AlgR family response regulator
MKVIILEDENRAVNHLKRLIQLVAPEMEVTRIFDTVRDAVPYLEKEPAVDLIFSDVQLADGISFEIFSKVSVKCPIIFTTAYDTYAIEAFNTNGIDYLLKPIEEERLRKAIEKARQFTTRIDLDGLLNLRSGTGHRRTKSRFMVKVGEKIKTIMVEDILAFTALIKPPIYTPPYTETISLTIRWKNLRACSIRSVSLRSTGSTYSPSMHARRLLPGPPTG